MKVVKEGIIILRGAPKQSHMGSFYQDQEFFYLSGVNEADVAVILFPETQKAFLYVPPYNPMMATWDGKRLSPGEKAAAATGFDEVRGVRGLHRELKEFLVPDANGKLPVVWTLLNAPTSISATSRSAGGAVRAQSRDRFDGRKSRPAAFKEKLQQMFEGLEVKDVSPFLNDGRKGIRGVKTKAERQAIAMATDVACQGIAEAMKSTEPGMYEYQVAAVARYVFSRLGAGPDAYGAIVGAGLNGCVLHYMANSKQIENGDLIVMDYGPTLNGYATDVTRTFPANGKFTKAQRKLVNDVHEIQAQIIEAVRPGATLGGLGSLCSKLLRKKGYISRHGPSHHVGLAVHDMGGNVLEPGMLITVEPGAYLKDQEMGCRIEDVILVTENGHINLSGHLPSDPDGIEKLMRKKGIAQQPIGLRKKR